MPRLVIIVEEASDLLISGGVDVEESILKLTQKSRAVGLHLLLATQRPSADILKGSIKANIPTRFAFRVPSSIDSSVVLDTTGAEKLLGKGDMLLSENVFPPSSRGLSFPRKSKRSPLSSKNRHILNIYSHNSLMKPPKPPEPPSDELFPGSRRFCR